MQFEVNALGPLRVAHALAANLVQGQSKVAFVSSKMGSMTATREGGKNGSAGYRCVGHACLFGWRSVGGCAGRQGQRLSGRAGRQAGSGGLAQLSWHPLFHVSSVHCCPSLLLPK